MIGKSSDQSVDYESAWRALSSFAVETPDDRTVVFNVAQASFNLAGNDNIPAHEKTVYLVRARDLLALLATGGKPSSPAESALVTQVRQQLSLLKAAERDK